MTTVGTDGLGGRASRGAAVTFGGQLGRVVAQLVGVVVLARLLDPSDFGLTAMVIAVIGLGEILRDFGLGMAAIQAKTLSSSQRSNLFWVNTAIGLAIGAIVFGASWLIAGFYDDDRLIAITQWLSLTFVINGIASQFRAHLQRQLRFAWLAAAEVLGIALGVGSAILLAIGGFGYWAIVTQQLVQVLVALTVVIVGARWLPGRFDRSAPMSDLYRFGWHLVGSQILTYASKNVDTVVIGAQFGAGPLGFYNRAFQLLALPLNQLNAPATRVAVPVLAKLHDDKVRYSRFLLTGQTALMHVTLAIFAALCALASPFIAVVLGPQWGGSVILFQILSISGVFQAAAYSTYWVFLSKGLTRQNLMMSLVYRPFLIMSVLVGSFWGVEGVAWGFAVGTAVGWPFGLFWLSRVSDAPVRSMFLTVLRSTTVYTIAGASAWAASVLLEDALDIAKLAAGAGAMLAALIVLFFVWPGFRRDVLSILHVVRSLRK